MLQKDKLPKPSGNLSKVTYDLILRSYNKPYIIYTLPVDFAPGVVIDKVGDCPGMYIVVHHQAGQ